MSLAKLWLSAGELPRSGSIKQLWQWLADPAQTNVERVFLGRRSQSLSRRGGPEAVPGPDSVAEWLPLIASLLDQQPKVGSRGRHAAVSDGRREAASNDELHEPGGGGRQAAATLVLAVLHGLLLDLLTTGDHTRVQQAFDLFGTVLDAITGTPDPPPYLWRPAPAAQIPAVRRQRAQPVATCADPDFIRREHPPVE